MRRLVAVGAALLLGALVAGCGAGTPPTSPPATATPSPAAAEHAWTATTPNGWQVYNYSDTSGARLTVAPADVDLSAAVAAGARLTVSPVLHSVPSAQSVAGAIANTDFVGDVVATTTTIAGHPAVSVQWTESGLFSSSGAAPNQTFDEILVDFGGGQAYKILLEAPATDWASAAPILQQIAGSLAYR